jgi:signal transduction histidine kinase
MQDRLERSRSALGNLAHALKTPLTVLVQLEDSETVRQQPQLRQQLTEQTGTIRQIIDRQLKRARLAGVSTPGLMFEPGREFEGLVTILKQIYGERGLEIELDIPPDKSFAGDREDMLELFGNLLDNACKWASSRVLVTVSDAPGLEVSVEDDGPGCPPELREQLSQRGRRLDESTAGHGLGLAIVRDIVEYYQGTMEFGQSDKLGGFRVDVALPGKA